MKISELEKKIFTIDSEKDFESIAFEVFHYQLKENELYRSYAEHLGRTTPRKINEIPFLPIEFFKTHKVFSGKGTSDLIFKSSGTTGTTHSLHNIFKEEIYQKSFISTYKKFIGDPKDQVILALLPNYLEQGSSSLVYMVDKLIKFTKNELSSFVLNDPRSIEFAYAEAIKSGKKVVIFGVSYALLDLAEKGLDLSEARIIETGGMKGRRKEITKEELHTKIIQGTGVKYVSSEYGMTELLSQAYSDEHGVFTTPAWMKVFMRDMNDPFEFIGEGKTGGINVIDLANLYSCSFIATQDLGKQFGSRFTVLGRFDNSDIRGCNMLVE